MEMFLDATTVFAAFLSLASGLWAIKAFEDLDYQGTDFRHGRFDVLLMFFVVITTGVSGWHLAMMVHWAIFPGEAATSTSFFVSIGFWNIAASLALSFGHMIARLAFTTGNKERLSTIYLFGSPSNAKSFSP